MRNQWTPAAPVYDADVDKADKFISDVNRYTNLFTDTARNVADAWRQGSSEGREITSPPVVQQPVYTPPRVVTTSTVSYPSNRNNQLLFMLAIGSLILYKLPGLMKRKR